MRMTIAFGLLRRFLLPGALIVLGLLAPSSPALSSRALAAGNTPAIRDLPAGTALGELDTQAQTTRLSARPCYYIGIITPSLEIDPGIFGPQGPARPGEDRRAPTPPLLPRSPAIEYCHPSPFEPTQEPIAPLPVLRVRLR